MLRLAVTCVLGAIALGCTDGGRLPGLGEPCTILCATGLTCAAGGYCTKTCICDGGALCNNSSLATGCPPLSTCVASSPSGGGSCAVVCADLGCPVGEAACARAPDGTPVCVGPGYPWLVRDGSASD